MEQPLINLEYRITQLKIREHEVKSLIDDIHKPDFLQKYLGFNCITRLDLSRLVVGGHSFGGMTALEVARNDSRVKAVFTFDPWVYAMHRSMLEGAYKVTQPMIHIVTEHFPSVVSSYFKYDTMQCLQSLLA